VNPPKPPDHPSKQIDENDDPMKYKKEDICKLQKIHTTIFIQGENFSANIKILLKDFDIYR